MKNSTPHRLTLRGVDFFIRVIRLRKKLLCVKVLNPVHQGPWLFQHLEVENLVTLLFNTKRDPQTQVPHRPILWVQNYRAKYPIAPYCGFKTMAKGLSYIPTGQRQYVPHPSHQRVLCMLLHLRQPQRNFGGKKNKK